MPFNASRLTQRIATTLAVAGVITAGLTSAIPQSAEAAPQNALQKSSLTKAKSAKKTRSTSTASCDRRTKAPYFVYKKGPGKQTGNGTLHMWVTINGCRKHFTARAGSGLPRQTDSCKRGVGAIPNGTTAVTAHFNKTWGSRVVQGHVWRLGDMRCVNGTPRTELFIHSNGPNGVAWNGSYATNGCIKLSQADRARFSKAYRQAWGKGGATLTVKN